MTENNFEIKKPEVENSEKTNALEKSLQTNYTQEKIQQENINSKITGEYKNEDIVSGEINLEVGIEKDPRFKAIIEQALDGVDLSEKALMENPEVVEEANKLAKKGDSKNFYKYLLEGVAVLVLAVFLNSCASNGVYRAETAEGGFKQTAYYAIADVLFKKAREAGYEPGPLGRRVLESADNAIGEQVRDDDIPAKMEEVNNAYEYGLKHPNAECSIYISGEGNKRNGYHEYNACKKGKADRKKNYNQQNNNSNYKINNTNIIGKKNNSWDVSVNNSNNDSTNLGKRIY